MEDDMSHHEQARRDCLDALEDYPILGAPTTGGTDTDALANGNGDTMNGSPSPPNTFSELSKESLQAICQTPGGELTEDELMLLLARKRNKYPKSQMVSLGDLGRKDIRHEQGDAGTTKSFVDAKSYFDDFGGIPYELVTVRTVEYKKIMDCRISQTEWLIFAAFCEDRHLDVGNLPQLYGCM